MAKIFCLKCNASTEFSSSKPKFCSHCGKPYIDATSPFQPSLASSMPTVAISKPSSSRGLLNRQIEEDDAQYPEDSQSVPQIDKIEVSFTLDNLRPNRQTGKEVYNEGTPSLAAEVLSQKRPSKVKVNKEQEKQNKEQFKEQFRNQLSKHTKNERPSTEING